MADKISLQGLDKAEVLAALYNGARAQGMGFFQYDPKPMTKEEAAQQFGNGFFDYLNGRVMKVNLAGDMLDPWAYDRDNGQGAAERIVNALRDNQGVTADSILMQHAEATKAAAQETREHINDEDSFGDGVVKLGLSEFKDKLDPILKRFIGE